MSVLIKNVVTFKHISNLPENAIVNTWYFLHADDPISAADIADCGAALNRFYCADPHNAVSVSAPMDFMSYRTLSLALPTVDHYLHDLDVPFAGWGSPSQRSELLGWAPGQVNPLPEEVAVCMSYHGDLTGLLEDVPAGPAGPAGNLHPRARRRGRIFLGGLNVNAVTFDATGPHVSGDMQGSLAHAFRNLRDDRLSASSGAAGDAGNDTNQWCQWSPKDEVATPVVNGWIDNAFDTQRRRGGGPTVRWSTAA